MWSKSQLGDELWRKLKHSFPSINDSKIIRLAAGLTHYCRDSKLILLCGPHAASWTSEALPFFIADLVTVLHSGYFVYLVQHFGQQTLFKMCYINTPI